MEIIQKHLHIYVLNWNQAEITIGCLRSLVNLSSPIPYTIFIIDNGSIDNSVEIFNQTFPEIEVLQTGENLGYQGGMNLGIQHGLNAQIDYLLLLNNDTVADSAMLTELFRLFPEEADLVSPGIYLFDKKDKLCSLGGNFNPILLEVMGSPRPEYEPPSNVVKYEFLPSHAWLVKSSVFEKIGLFDRDFFPIYYDDLDFCLRMSRAGCKLYLIPQAKIYHLGSMSVGGKNSPKERYLMARNSGYYFRKNMKFWQAPFIFLFRLGSGIIWTFRLLFQNNFAAIDMFWKGFVEGWFKPLPSK